MTSEEFYTRSLRMQTAALTIQFMQFVIVMKANREELGDDTVRVGTELATDVVKEALGKDFI